MQKVKIQYKLFLKGCWTSLRSSVQTYRCSLSFTNSIHQIRF